MTNSPNIPNPKRRGPTADRVKIEGMDWTEAVAHALQKPMPAKAAKAAPKPRKPKK